tara:strand:- start:162 stop:473 length:312 start_codon:yes stop_codon:yes gene_type:complete
MDNKINEEMKRPMTLGRFIALTSGIVFLLISWLKTHEDRQDKELKTLNDSSISHDQRIRAMEEFKEDVKVFQEKQESNHIETLSAISGLTTNIEVLVERSKHE